MTAQAASQHWAVAYIGRPWIAGVAECWHFAALIWSERFGIDVTEVLAASGDERRARRLIDAHPERDLWQRVEVPAEGDAVLMTQGSRPTHHPNHIGVFVAPCHVLHAIRGPGGIFTPISGLAGLGYRVAGYYRRAT